MQRNGWRPRRATAAVGLLVLIGVLAIYTRSTDPRLAQCVLPPSLLILGPTVPAIEPPATCVTVNKQITGHAGATSNFIHSIPLVTTNWAYNPTCESHLDRADIVYVLADGPSVDYATEMKRSGRAALFYLGPNIVLYKDHIPPADAHIVPSSWVADTYSHQFRPSVRCLVWPTGVDTSFWIPRGTPHPKRAVLYIKNEASDVAGPLIQATRNLLRDRTYETIDIVYGSYTAEGFLDALQRSAVNIVFSPSESQGIALFESWAADVPTLVWTGDTGAHYSYNRTWLSSSAPYLSARTGTFFSTAVHLARILSAMDSGQLHFRPREWIMEHGSWEATSRRVWNDMLNDWKKLHGVDKICR
jgi:hypothetical protein